MSDDDNLVRSLRLVLRQWISPEGTRVRFRRADALLNRGRRVIITANPASLNILPEAVGVITDATATDGDLTIQVEIRHGALTVGFAKLLTDHPEGCGVSLVLASRPRGNPVAEIRNLYPLPALPDEPRCSPDCPHHTHPTGAAAKHHAARRAALPRSTVQEAHHG
jgi:hypothetical protein